MLLFSADTEQLIEWFEFISNDSELRKAAYIMPASYLLSRLMPQELIDYAYKSLLECEPTPVDNEELQLSKEEFWCFVFADGYHRHPKGMEWLKQKLLDESVNPRLYIPLVRIFTETIDISTLIDFLPNKAFIAKLKEYNAKNFFIAGLLCRQDEINVTEFSQLPVEDHDKTISGLHFYISNKETELDVWARNICEESIKLLDEPPHELNLDENMEIELDNNGVINSVGRMSGKSVSVIGTTGASSWGVYTGHEDRLSDIFNRDERDEKFKEDFLEWKKKREQFTLWRGNEIGEFNARKPFEEWSRKNEMFFKNFAINYLDKLAKSSQHFNCMALFTDTILCIYSEFDCETSYNYFKNFLSLIDVIVLNEYYVPTFISKIWSLKNDNPKLFELRKRILYDCLDDELIMYNAIAALSNMESSEIISFFKEAFLQGELSKNRNIGVSILPWIANDESIEILNSIIKNDASSWVEHHAEWALRVAKQEKLCRELYRDSLLSKDLNKISMALIQMKPVLLPTARWWRKDIEGKINFENICDVKTVTFVEKFWYHWDGWSNNKSNIKVNGRILTEWCRGEILDNTVTPRLSPWWKVNY